MTPGLFRPIQVEHPVVEMMRARESGLHKLPEEELTSRTLSNTEKIMNEADALHVGIDVEVIFEEKEIET